VWWWRAAHRTRGGGLGCCRVPCRISWIDRLPEPDILRHASAVPNCQLDTSSSIDRSACPLAPAPLDLLLTSASCPVSHMAAPPAAHMWVFFFLLWATRVLALSGLDRLCRTGINNDRHRLTSHQRAPGVVVELCRGINWHEAELKPRYFGQRIKTIAGRRQRRSRRRLFNTAGFGDPSSCSCCVTTPVNVDARVFFFQGKKKLEQPAVTRFCLPVHVGPKHCVFIYTPTL
jgi:hypothetical protein